MIISWTYLEHVTSLQAFGMTYSCTEPDVVLHPAVYVRVPIHQQVSRVEIHPHVIKVER